MKKLILTLILATFMSVSFVDAAEISCSTSINLLKPNNFIDGLYKPFDYSPTSIGYVSISYNGLIPVEPSTSYHYQHDHTFTTTPYRVAVAYYDKDFNYLSYINNKVASGNHSYTFTTLDNAYYITLHLYQATTSKLNTVSYQLEKGTKLTSYVPYEECITEDPDTPIVADTTLDSFYSLYIDKLTSLTDFAMENKFVLSAITIVLVLVCLELFLYLFKGGNH